MRYLHALPTSHEDKVMLISYPEAGRLAPSQVGVLALAGRVEIAPREALSRICQAIRHPSSPFDDVIIYI